MKANSATGRPTRPCGPDRRRRLLPAIATFVTVLAGWDSAAAGAEPAAPVVEKTTGFADVTESVGFGYRIRPEADPVSNADMLGPLGGGLAATDIDGDGRLELHVAHGYGQTGRLFSWNGRRFVRLEGNRGIEPSGIDRAGYFIDLDQDGWPDFVSTGANGVQSFRNDGTGRFEEATDTFAIGGGAATYSMAAGDYDGDGDLDLFFAHWSKRWSGSGRTSGNLWRNDGKGRYEDVSHIVPIRLLLSVED